MMLVMLFPAICYFIFVLEYNLIKFLVQMLKIIDSSKLEM